MLKNPYHKAMSSTSAIFVIFCEIGKSQTQLMNPGLVQMSYKYLRTQSVQI